MAVQADWVPMLWPAGPLEIARREQRGGCSAEVRDVLRRWQEPSSLALLKGTAVNCVVAQWAAGLAQDGEQQRALAPLVAAARSAGIAFVGVVGPKADGREAASAASSAGLSALLVEGAGSAGGSVSVIQLSEETNVPWKSAASTLAITGVRWPGISMGNSRESEDVNAGPTQAPWIDSNAYLLQIAAARGGPGKRFWLLFDPPAEKRVVVREQYLRAVADTEMGGGSWVLSLDDDLRGRIASGEPRAIETWNAVAGAAAFFRQHPGWRSAAGEAEIAVLSDFAGPNEAATSELLNLLARRNVPFRLVDASGPATPPLEEYRAVCCLDETSPRAEVRKPLENFAARGGLLIVSRPWGASGPPAPGLDHPRFDLRRLGKGRVAVCREESPDPYLLARDIHLLLGRTNDLLRFFNISALIARYTAPSPGSALLQFVNFAQRARDDVITAWVGRRFRSARLWNLGSQAVPVEVVEEAGGTAVRLPSIPVYAGIELAV